LQGTFSFLSEAQVSTPHSYPLFAEWLPPFSIPVPHPPPPKQYLLLQSSVPAVISALILLTLAMFGTTLHDPSRHGRVSLDFVDSLELILPAFKTRLAPSPAASAEYFLAPGLSGKIKFDRQVCSCIPLVEMYVIFKLGLISMLLFYHDFTQRPLFTKFMEDPLLYSLSRSWRCLVFPLSSIPPILF